MNRKIIAIFIAALIGIFAFVPTTTLSTVDASSGPGCAFWFEYRTADGQQVLATNHPRLPYMGSNATSNEDYVVASSSNGFLHRKISSTGWRAYNEMPASLNGRSGTLRVNGNRVQIVIGRSVYNLDTTPVIIEDGYGHTFQIRQTGTTCRIPVGKPSFATMGAAGGDAGGVGINIGLGGAGN